MNAHFQVFKGAPRWRDPIFWMVLAFYAAILAWNLYRGRGWRAFPLLTPVYLWLMLPSRLFVGENWLISISSLWTLSGFHHFESIENDSYRDEGPNSQYENVSVTLILVRTKAPTRRTVSAEIQRGARFADFVAAMEARGVSGIENRAKNKFADKETVDAIFSPPFESLEAEREALYRLLNRPMPK